MSYEQTTNKPLTASAGTAWDVASLWELVAKMVWRLPGCADLAVRMSLCNAWRKFCDISEAWRVRREATLIDCSACDLCGAIETVGEETVFRYKLCVPASCHVKSVFKIWINDEVLENDGSNWGTTEAGECGKVIEIFGNIEDSATDVVKASYSIIPDDDGETVPRAMLRKYGPVIVSGALYPLMGQDGKPWSDATMARLEMDNWNAGLNEASFDGIVAEKKHSLDKTNGRRVDILPYGNFN